MSLSFFEETIMIFKTDDEIKVELEAMVAAGQKAEAVAIAKDLGIEVEETEAAVATAVIEVKGPSRKTVINMARRRRKEEGNRYPAASKQVEPEPTSPFEVMEDLKCVKVSRQNTINAQVKTLLETAKGIKNKEKAEFLIKCANSVKKEGEPYDGMVLRNLIRSVLVAK